MPMVWRHLELGQLPGPLWLVHLYAYAPRLPVERVSGAHRMDRAHNRHLSAVRALAQMGKMGPAVQINIAVKQTNTVR